MKKLTKFSLLGLALSLCVGAAVGTGIKNDAVAVVAANPDPTMVFETDETNADPRVYSQSGSDLDYLPFSSMSVDTTPDNYSVSGGSTFVVTEKTSNKLFNYIYQSFFIYSFVPAKTRYHYTITLQLSLTKSASGGSAPARAELFKLGASDSTTNHLLPSLTNNRFITNFTESTYGTSINNCTTSANSAGMLISYCDRTVTADLDITYDGDNYTNTNQVCRYQLGLMVGCNYASSYNHQAQAVVSVKSKTVTSTPITTTVVYNGNRTCYTSIDTAFSEASSGATVTLVNNATWNTDSTNSSYLAKNLTLNLDGYTLSMGEFNDGIGVKSGYTLTINGGGGSIVNNSNDTQYAQPILYIASGGTMTVSNVTLSKPNGGNAVVEVFGTFNASTNVTISTNSAYINGYAVRVWDTGATANLNGVTVNSSQTAISVEEGAMLICHNCTISSSNSYAIATNNCLDANEIYLSGSTTLSHGGNATANISMYSTGGNDKIYGYHTSYLSVAVSVAIVGTSYSDGTTVVSSDKNKKVSIVSYPATGYEYARSGNNIVYQRIKYTVSFDSNGGSGSIASRSIAYGETTNLPACSFTAPAGKKFLEWNTKANGTGVSKNPGDTYQPAAKTTFYAIWVDTAKAKIENNLTTQSSLYFRYVKNDNDTYNYPNIVIRFGAFFNKNLWDELATETTIQGFGVLITQANYISGDPVSDFYEDAPTDPLIEDFYAPTAVPSLATPEQKGELVGNYYIWNKTYSIDESNLTTTYVAAAYIKTTSGVVFMNEVRTSAAKIAYDLINTDGVAIDSADGALKNLADMYN